MKFHFLTRERERGEGAGGTVPRLSKTSVLRKLPVSVVCAGDVVECFSSSQIFIAIHVYILLHNIY